MEKLTKAEEQVMQVLWKLEQAFLKEVMAEMPSETHQSTVSTILRILHEKGYASHERFGKAHRYYPLVKKEEYARAYLGSFLERYFNGSFAQMLSFFHRKGDLDLADLDDVMRLAEGEEKEKGDRSDQ
jgi:BlaI family transcriptional regulator, penicillinase repressor